MSKSKDLTGQRFGKLLVIGKAEDKISKSGRIRKRWKCQCDCGNVKEILGENLTSGNTQSCGCIANENKELDFIGAKFGRLTVTKRIENQIDKNGKPHSTWECKCECGNVVAVRGTYLKSGAVKSCGCLNKDALRSMLTIHGESRTRLYKIWAGIKERCYNVNDNEYNNYGGRGIIMADEWLNNYRAFREWAYSNGYHEDPNKEPCSIDRIDNNGNYSPENCRWVGRKIQQNNTRHNHYVEYNGECHTVAEWADIYRIEYNLFYRTLKRCEWSLKQALSIFTINKNIDL